MKGWLTQQPYIPDPDNYTNLQVCKSAAGFYIGTMYNNPEGWQEPGSRESEYFATRGEAEEALKEESWDQRRHP